jgi:hypothetical protein
MTLSKNYQESTSASSLRDLLHTQRRMQRQHRQESRSSAPDSNEESGYLLRSSTAAPSRGTHRTSRSMDTLRSILRLAIAVLEESDDEPDNSVISSRLDDSNSQP